jgi:hypothetical protein
MPLRRSGPSFVFGGSSSLRHLSHADWFHKNASSLLQATAHLDPALYMPGSCMRNQIHIHVAWQIRLPMPSSLRHHDQAQEDASENCCNGKG